MKIQSALGTGFEFFASLLKILVLGQLSASIVGTGSNIRGNARPDVKGFTVKALYDYTAADKDEVGSMIVKSCLFFSWASAVIGFAQAEILICYIEEALTDESD